MDSNSHAVLNSFEGIGYVRNTNGLPLVAITMPIPHPGPDQVLIRAAYCSLNPLDYKLAELNFLKRTPPVILGFDLAGIVVAVGKDVTGLSVGDEVAAMADGNGDGGLATGGRGGFALARDYYTVKKPAGLNFAEAAALPLCFIAAFLGLDGHVSEGDTVYIPGGGGGVGHLAIQLARNIFRAGMVISSGSTPESMALARACGAHYVFNYKTDDIGAEVARLSQHRGIDVAFDITYSEQSFIDTARMVREGGKWVVLGVGPGKTTRTTQTHSPVVDILAERKAHMVNANMLRYFQEPALLGDAARAYFKHVLESAMEWAVNGTVVPRIDRVIQSTVEEVNAALATMKGGRAPVGKIVVQLDKEVR